MRMNRRARPEVPKYSDSPLLTGPFVRPWKPEEELLPARSLHALARSRCPIKSKPGELPSLLCSLLSPSLDLFLACRKASEPPPSRERTCWFQRSSHA